EIYTLSLHDALPIWSIIIVSPVLTSRYDLRILAISRSDPHGLYGKPNDEGGPCRSQRVPGGRAGTRVSRCGAHRRVERLDAQRRSEEHTSELQSRRE